MPTSPIVWILTAKILLRLPKQLHWTKPKNKPQQLWSFIKANKGECIDIPTLQTNGQTITNDHDKAKTLNKQFSSVFTQ